MVCITGDGIRSPESGRTGGSPAPLHSTANSRAKTPGRAPAGRPVRGGQWSARRLVDRPAPGARLRAAGLDEVLESLHVALDPPLNDAERGTRLLDRALRLDLQLERDAAAALVEPMERHHACVAGALDRGPGDALVRLLLGDPSLPRLVVAADVRDPLQGGVVELTDGLHALHERREALELGPLVIRGADGYRDVDGFHDLGHIGLLAPGVSCCRRHAGCAGWNRNAHRVGGRSWLLAERHPAVESDRAAPRPGPAHHEVHDDDHDDRADDRRDDGAQIERSVDRVRVEQDTREETTDERADDAQHDVADDAEAFVTSDEEAGEIPGDRAEHDPGDDAHR